MDRLHLLLSSSCCPMDRLHLLLSSSCRPMACLLRLLFIGIRLGLLVLSVVGWIVFVVGFVHLKTNVHRYYTNPDTFPFPPEYAKTFLSLANTLFIPMWVFVASGFATYIPLALHILVCHENIRHILHSAFMFFNVFFMFGGSGTLLISMAFSMGKSAETLRGTVHLDEASSRIVFYGASIAIGLYWISTLIWPWFNLKRRTKVFNYHQVNIQEEEQVEERERWMPAPGQRKFYSNSGKFSTSRELYQQVSEEEGNYTWSE